MIPNNHMLSPEVAMSVLTLAVEVIVQVQAGRVVVLDKSGITVDGNIWKQMPVAGSDSTNQPVNTFQLRDGKWVVGYDGTETLFKDLVSFKYIHLLLARKPISPGQLISLANCRGSRHSHEKPTEYNFAEGGSLEGLSIHSNSKVPLQTKEAHKNIRNELHTLKSELELSRADGNREQVEELEETIEMLEQQLKKANFKGLDRAFSYQYKNDLDSVRIAIKRAITAIGTVNPALAWHLTCSIKFGSEFVYRLDKPVFWNL